MKRSFTAERIENCTAQLLVVPFVINATNDAYKHIKTQHKEKFEQTAKSNHFIGKKNDLFTFSPSQSQSIVVIGLGKSPQRETWREVFARLIKWIEKKQFSTCSVYFDTLLPDMFRASVEGALLGAYRFSKYKASSPVRSLTHLKFGVIDKSTTVKQGAKFLKSTLTITDAVTLCRDLVNEPTNQLGVSEFVSHARDIAKRDHLRCRVVSGPMLKKKGFGLIHAVGKGANTPPSLLELEYQPMKKNAKNIALIGKGIVFDTGGLCLKPAEYMLGMKTDMAGAAVVLSVMSALSSLNILHNVTAYIPLAENAIGQNAMRPGDIIKSYSDKTVEVINTDAEGRLVLADALAYANEQNHDEIFDFATLTGACAIALGKKRGALFSDNISLIDAWQEAAKQSGELLWPLPLAKELEAEIMGDISDLKNSGGRFGGAITAALFLKRFVSASKWVHFDIAGPARNASHTYLCPKGGTGFLVATALQYLMK